MKKFLATILAFIYLTTSVGATINMHYCMDKLVAWGLGNEQSKAKACSYCGMVKSTEDKGCLKESKGCCKDEQKMIKLENDQKISEASFKFSHISFETIAPVFFDHSLAYVSSLTEQYPLTHAPPREETVSLFVLNCVFRI